MKTKRNVFSALGWLFIVFNALGYINSIAKGETVFDEKSVSYIMGYNFFFLLGIAFLLMVNRQKRKMHRQKEKEVLENSLVEQSGTEDNAS